MNCTHVVLHAGSDKPSKLNKAAIQPRADEQAVHLYPFRPHHAGKEIQIKSVSSPQLSAQDCVDNKDLICELREGALCGSGGHTSPPLHQSKQSSLGTESQGPSTGIARFWHRSKPYKARYRVRMPAMKLSLGSDAREELRYCRVSLVFTAKQSFSPANTLTGSSVIDQNSSMTFHTECWMEFVPL